ncbi:hypothetical protein CWATWH8502_4504 [Crocosphaera watsonii WH 8502]|uniref:Uncharacterized protein n=2 Tax=Crocosphaera watsonii TaxID=263511 RepID=T2JH73_CROWT|nr:hypothetical protein CWATWH8502_4504 [Crocosphaera watsonii WH 8502]CCQ64404.1 hypothetical protein CWATWH0401_4463 [Crocosphaera watsonii WH 0401]
MFLGMLPTKKIREVLPSLIQVIPSFENRANDLTFSILG